MTPAVQEALDRIDKAAARGQQTVEIDLPNGKLARKTARTIARHRRALSLRVRKTFSAELRLYRLRQLHQSARRRLGRRLWLLRFQILAAWLWLLLLRTWLYLLALLLLAALAFGLYFAATRLMPPGVFDRFRPGATSPAPGAPVPPSTTPQPGTQP